jgi:membrane protease subunit (stomatin/prohibitin family)
MGLFTAIKNQFRSVIEWKNPDPGILFTRWTDNGDEIKNASKLIVGPGQGCVFVYQGKVESVIVDEGIVELATANIPFWTTLSKFMQGFKSEHKVGLYFFRNAKTLDQKWGTPSVIKYMDPVYKFPVGLRAFGNYSFRITHPGPFFTNVVASAHQYTIEEFRKVMGSRIIQPLADYLAEQSFTYSDIDSKRNEISEGLAERLAREFNTLGFGLDDFRIEGTSFDEDTMRRINRISDMNAEAQAAAAAGLSYAQLQQLDAMKAAAANPGGGAGMGMGMGAGMAFGNMMAQGMAQQGFAQAPYGGQQAAPAAPAAPDPMETLGKLKKLLDNGLISQEEYDAKKKEVLASM